jgi:hypothetical protein
MAFNSTFGRVFSPTVQPKSVASGGGWWLAGGIAPANCVAAYQAKGATSKAASLVNLAQPGTYDLTETGTVNWDAVAGWTGFTSTTDYLTSTAVIPGANPISASIVFFYDAWFDGNFYALNGTNIRILHTTDSYRGFFGNSVQIFFGNYPGRGVIVNGGYIGNKLYYGGSYKEEFTTGTGDIGGNIKIGGGSINYVDAFFGLAMYNTVLTDSQAVALYTAMNAF